ncbi:2-oxoacid:acceptor oxidoreductase subunit alpha [Rhizobiaceae bacterium BDR2-2]|uniref:2-oxoacid:acceptor oxidoreductase subunit alpha n=1 Tax=Ectorhizobium quercum TaxID=2965071 RepID=A0AAE3MZS8_9HYPH|nr:2-oxoacid:acceptor oxidoreductase subunit alpha [Ectorhizobium quercum]MCX8997451.1 2-oxoacid:acceptor oxidoreductase subunit alpha [Ectorhizobium quercum]
MTRSSLALVFSGSGGAGAMSAGQLILSAAAEAGYYGAMSKLFGAQVRGGEAASLVQVSTGPVICQPDRYDLFIALDWANAAQFATEIPLGRETVILCDPRSGPVPKSIAASGGRVVPVGLGPADATPLEKALRGRHVNIFAAGLAAALLGLPAAKVHAVLSGMFSGKGAEVARDNAASLEAGLAAGAALGEAMRLDPPQPAARWLISGNEALAMGALRGGIRFVGCYPITPSTDLVEWMSPRLARLGGRLTMGEDELAAINMVLGASYGGTPAMTVTSGPGLSLMGETIGLAVAAEVPAVIIDVMRGGPSTGLPSKTEQSDIGIAVFGGHGDAPRIVLAPTSIRDCLFTGEWAVHLAEGYQTPVIVLSDQSFGLSPTVIDPKPDRPPALARRTDLPEDEPFRRYATSGDPVTPMPLPGTPGGQWVGEGLTHNETGIPVSGARMHAAQIDKRARKIASFDPGPLWGDVLGDGETAILTFGSGIGPAQAAAERLTAAGQPTRVIGLRVISPLPLAALAQALDGVKRVIVMEQNHGAQLYHYLLGQRAIQPDAESFARPGPLPFRPGEIAAVLAEKETRQ